jgi:alpha-glucosidase
MAAVTLSAYGERPWWASAVFYQIYPRSYADGNGDGTGDLIGVRQHLDHLVALGVDAIWLSPFYRSPMADGGYDVADPCDVDPLFGTLADFDALLADAHERGLRVTIDIVPNHFSDRHVWFQQALAAEPGSPERARFIFRDGRGRNGELPPNNWPSMFGGPAWTRLPDGQWYLHLFAPEQPDLDWSNPEVPDEFERIMRFWLDRGVDGFRVDVAHGIAKEPGLPDMDLALIRSRRRAHSAHMPDAEDLRFDRDGVHQYHERFRRILDSYPGDRMAVGEAWVADSARLARYVAPGGLNLTFNFQLVEAPWGAETFRSAIDRSLHAMSEVGAPCTWVLANHDVNRISTRYGGGPVGLARARAAALVQLSLPGAAYIYNGDELGLANVDLPDEALQDPAWERTGHKVRGRDGERVPVPWSGTEPPYGFTTGASTWLPMPDDWARLTVAAEEADPSSPLHVYRTALQLRRKLAGLQGEDLTWLETPDGCLAFRRGDLSVWLNAGAVAVPLPAGELVHASGPVGELVHASGPADRVLPPDTCVWLRG